MAGLLLSLTTTCTTASMTTVPSGAIMRKLVYGFENRSFIAVIHRRRMGSCTPQGIHHFSCKAQADGFKELLEQMAQNPSTTSPLVEG